MRGLHYCVGASGRALLELAGTETRVVGTNIETVANRLPAE